MEGMTAFGRRHFAALRAHDTRVICLDAVGSPELLILEGEGMLAMNEYPAEFKTLVAECADAAAGIPLPLATDVPDNVDLSTTEAAVRLTESVIRRLAG